ncbi:YfjI family protein [Halopseudomonas pelagia]|uniref:YfjI family protein n=1 Tax=Halopseudomonas pelagia TaxID=553151 RepID=UPI001379116C|nr:YfjI family protein [Halopseudomonas pelagia]
MALPVPGSPLYLRNDLPGLVMAAVSEVTSNTKAPFDLALMAALTAGSIALQGAVDVQAPTGVRTPVSIMTFALAESGERKTAVEKHFLSGLRTFQGEQKEKYRKEMADWKLNQEAWSDSLKAKKRALSRKGADREEFLEILKEMSAEVPIEPTSPTFLYDDTTISALLQRMHEGSKNAALVSSEGGTIFKGHAFRSLPVLNSLWSGSDCSIERSTTGSIEIVDGRLTISVSVQPGVMREFIERKGDEARDIGFWARALIFTPISTQGARFEFGGKPGHDAMERFNERIIELLRLSVDDDTQGFVRQVITFEESLEPYWLAICNAIEREINQGGRFENMKDHASKLADNIARVAALISCLEYGLGHPIRREALDAAISICMYCSDNFSRLFNALPQPIQDAETLLAWLGRFSLRGIRYMKKNRIMQYGPSCVRKKSRLDAALDWLVISRKLVVGRYEKTSYVDLMPWAQYEPYRMMQEVAYGY